MARGRNFLERIYALQDERDVRAFYDDAAGEYDDILISDVGYVSPEICARALAPHLPDRDAVLMDLGCGTGLAGLALAGLGYQHIDGVDFSLPMLAVARSRGCYSHLAHADLNAHLDIPSGRYSAAVSVGVYGQHVPAESLDEALRIVVPAGVVCFSVNERAFEAFGFESKIESLVSRGEADCLSLSKEPYHVNESIDGWVCVLRTGRRTREV